MNTQPKRYILRTQNRILSCLICLVLFKRTDEKDTFLQLCFITYAFTLTKRKKKKRETKGSASKYCQMASCWRGECLHFSRVLTANYLWSLSLLNSKHICLLNLWMSSVSSILAGAFLLTEFILAVLSALFITIFLSRRISKD